LNIVVTVATYKRPQLLHELLGSLEAVHERTPFRMIVIDNDPAGSGGPIVRGAAFPIIYAVEPKPGIVAARNAAFELLPDDATHVVFVDDDETVVSSDWLATLVEVGERYSADIVSGPVQSIFLEGTPSWIVKGGYIQRPDEAEGLTTRTPATNNTIVALDAIRRSGILRFDESFSQTGGSDTNFFSGLIASGASVAWAPAAMVSEVVPLDRLTFRWVMRRYIRVNNVSGRLMLRRMSRTRLLAKAVASIAYGIPKTAFALVRGKGLRLVDTRYITRGFGWIGAASNHLVQEYAREASPKE
jgi:succinoglycan biosynthesis protein ExoM